MSVMKVIAVGIMACLLAAAPCEAGFMDDLLKGLSTPAPARKGEALGEGTIADGLKEALSVATKNSVRAVSKPDGYFGNPKIKIPFPEKIRNVADVLRKVGFQREVDDFVLSMNRAAERAAPRAASIFMDAIKDMTIEDARGILNGGDTAATEYFKEKTSERLYTAFKPPISESMDAVGATRAYKDVMARYSAIPFVRSEDVDLDHYVTNKALDGLFHMLGEEEKKIRTDPAARVTDLLKKVFAR